MVDNEKVLVYEFISAGGMEATDGDDDELLAQGMAMRDALVFDLLRGRHRRVACLASARAPLPEALRDAVDVIGVAADAMSAPSLLARLAPGYDQVWVIAPESGGVLAALQRAVGDARWVGCDAHAIAVTSSKRATLAHLAARGIAVPACWMPGEASFPGGRWVVKPDDGAGCVATRRHDTFDAARRDLLARRARGEAATAQSWIDGEPLSLSLLCTPGATEMLAINRQRIAVQDDGAVRYLGVDCNVESPGGARGERLSALARRVRRALPGLAGYVGIDLVWSPLHGPVVVEINPRLTCAYIGLSAALGRNLAVEALRACGREAVPDAVC